MRSGLILLVLALAATVIAGVLFPPFDGDAPPARNETAAPSANDGPAPAGPALDMSAAMPSAEPAAVSPSEGKATTGQVRREGARPQVGERVARAVRDVTPQGMTPGPQIDGPLTRVAGQAPPPPPPARQALFHRVIIMDAGTIRTGEATIRLAGIEAPAILKFCTDSAGKRWPCGRAARTALRRLVRTRAIACRAPRLKAGVRATLACTVGTTDLSLWLVTQGWAEADPGAGAALRDAENDARQAGRGLWR